MNRDQQPENAEGERAADQPVDVVQPVPQDGNPDRDGLANKPTCSSQKGAYPATAPAYRDAAAMAALLERDREHDAIRDGLSAVRRGEGRCVLVEGPAGIGKTALLAAARAQARTDSYRVLSGTWRRAPTRLPLWRDPPAALASAREAVGS